MQAPLPTPDPRPAPPPVRLDVRLHGGRPVGYPIAGEFLVGAAEACDLRIPGIDLPPVVCQFTRSGDRILLRRHGEAPLRLNDSPLKTDEPLDVHDGDRLSLGPVEILVINKATTSADEHLHPKLIPVETAPQAAGDPLDRRELERLREDLARRQAAVDEQARELEEDRKIWYRRRHEMEAELEQLRAKNAAGAASRFSERDAYLTHREADLKRIESELGTMRDSLGAEYQAKRDELVRMIERVRGDSAQLELRRAALDDDFARQRGEQEAALFARREQGEREFAARQRDVEAEIAKKRLEFEDELRQAEPRIVQMRLEREQLEAARKAVNDERRAMIELRSDLTRERQAFDTERAWQTERSEKQETDVAGRERDLARREEHLKSEKATLDAERNAHKDDLVRLDRWQGSMEQRQTLLDARAAEIDERFAQMRRDAAELEIQIQLLAKEEERRQSESERLDRLRADIDTQAMRFAERSSQVEAQQAMLAVLRGKLDRQQEEIRLDTEKLFLDRQQQEQTRRELDEKLRDAEMLRSELGFLRDDHDAKQQAIAEQQSLLATTLEDIRRQKEDVAAADARFKDREQDLDTRAAEIAEQAATLKAKLQQAMELHQRLDADRLALREREAALADAESARQSLQEQLRRRADDLSGRNHLLDATAREVAEEKAVIERHKSSIDEWRSKAEIEVAAERHRVETDRAELEKQAAALIEREKALEQQVGRIKEINAAIAAERKSLFEARQAWEADQANFRQQDLSARHESESFKVQVARQVAELRRQAPDIEQRATAALEKLGGARDVLRGHLQELHEFANQSRQALVAESEQVRQREQVLEQARAEHRAAVSAFRQQMLDWQAKVTELRQAMNQHDSRSGDRQAELNSASERMAAMEAELTRRTDELHAEQRIAIEKRNEMERHLADMREWYRHKLRDLAAGRPIDDADMPAWEPIAVGANPPSRPLLAVHSPPVEADAADHQLGALLKMRGLVDDAALDALQTEANRQRKSLRQTLLASGVVTLYQLALIEAGNLDGLVLDRFRVIDRVRASARETVYRVYDPERPTHSLLLRLLGDEDSADGVRRAEFHQRFHAATAVQHPNLANVLEVLEIQGRAAALTESASGLPSNDWPPLAATPGVWLQLVSEAARGLAAAHHAGLVHGRLAADSFILAGDGTLKITGLGEPGWLAGPNAVLFEPLPAADLRALGRAAYAWSQIGAKRRAGKHKAFPAVLTAIIRRLEANAESSMGDVVSLERPFADADELLRELDAQAANFPCPNDMWQKLLSTIGDAGGEEETLRQSA